MATKPKISKFDALAAEEEARRNALGLNFQNQIQGLKTGLGQQYDTALKNYQTTSAQRRSTLAGSLADQSKQAFQLQNPYILEDLNSRGLLTSPTAVSQGQNEALKQLELANQQQLTNFDTGSRTYEDQLAQQRLADMGELDRAGTSANIQSQQDALDSALNLRRSELESGLQTAQANREEQLARDLAKQEGRNQLTGSMIGLGGNVLGGALAGGKDGGTPFAGLANLFGGGGAGAVGGGVTGAATGQVVPGIGAVGTGVAPAAGFSPLLGGAGLLGAGLGAMALSRKGGQIGSGLGIGSTAGKIIGNPIGAQLNAAKKVTKKIFCFDGLTPIKMVDGSEKPICEIDLGDETKGGLVVSLRISTTEDSLMNYKGTLVTPFHAVKENGKWIRVVDSPHATVTDSEGPVFSLVTVNHRIFIRDQEFADEHETDEYEDLNLDESLEVLNSMSEAKRNGI